MGRLLSLLGGHNLGSLHGLGGAVTNLAGSVLIEALLLVSATHCLVAIMAARLIWRKSRLYLAPSSMCSILKIW